jgi:hypothetical protein
MIGVNLISALISAQVGELQVAAVGFLGALKSTKRFLGCAIGRRCATEFRPACQPPAGLERTSTSARKSVGISGGPTHLHAVAPDEIAGN